MWQPDLDARLESIDEDEGDLGDEGKADVYNNRDTEINRSHQDCVSSANSTSRQCTDKWKCFYIISGFIETHPCPSTVLVCTQTCRGTGESSTWSEVIRAGVSSFGYLLV